MKLAYHSDKKRYLHANQSLIHANLTVRIVFLCASDRHMGHILVRPSLISLTICFSTYFSYFVCRFPVFGRMVIAHLILPDAIIESSLLLFLTRSTASKQRYVPLKEQRCLVHMNHAYGTIPASFESKTDIHIPRF